MKRILSKSMLIAVILLVLLSAGCAKSAIPDTIAEVEQTWFSFREGEITYDELKEKIADDYIDFDKTFGDEIYVQWDHPDDQRTVLYKDLEGMSLDEIAALKENLDMLGEMQVVSFQVSVSKSADAVRDQQIVFSWREDTVGDPDDRTCKILSSRYFLTKEGGRWKIDRIDIRAGVYPESADEAEIERQRQIATHPYQDETEYVRTITLK
jgi:hypothetical protein